MAFTLNITESFKNRYKNFGKAPKKKIQKLIKGFSDSGYQAFDHYYINGHIVRNKPSTDVNTNDSDFRKKVQFAQKYKLWHIHAGFYHTPECDFDGYCISPIKNDLTSQWVILYQRIDDNSILLADLQAHPPLVLPSESILIKITP